LCLEQSRPAIRHHGKEIITSFEFGADVIWHKANINLMISAGQAPPYRLNKPAIKMAKEVRKIAGGSARWIACDAIRELTSEKVRKRLSNALAISLGCGVALDSKIYVSRIILC